MDYIDVSAAVDKDCEASGIYERTKDVLKLGIAFQYGHIGLIGSKADVERILSEMQDALKELTQ
jgi:hypothetical protein